MQFWNIYYVSIVPCNNLNVLTVFQIKARRNYSMTNFNTDSRWLMKWEGWKREKEKIFFTFDESEVCWQTFLERMNALLALGEVPKGDEYIHFLNMTRKHILKEIKGIETEENIYKALIKWFQRNLHVVFTLNVLSPDFLNRADSSPAFYNRCEIDWFSDWSWEGLFQFEKKLTEKADLRKDF